MVPSLLGIYSIFFSERIAEETIFLTNCKWPLSYFVIVSLVLKKTLHFNVYKTFNMGGQARWVIPVILVLRKGEQKNL